MQPADTASLKPLAASHHVHRDTHQIDHDAAYQYARISRFDLIRIGGSLLAASCVWFHISEPVPHFNIIGIAGILFSGWPIFGHAFENLGERRMTMELSMTIALLAAAAIGELFTALIITSFVLAAEILESMTVSQGRRAISDLLDLLPRSAWLVKERHAPPVQVPLDEIHAGDIVLIRPGATVPVDGEIIVGTSSVDEASITGEPLPRDKFPGDRVFAGTLNQAGALEVAVEALGRETTFGKIVQAVENAEKTRAPIQTLADRIAGYLVYFALGSAALTLLIAHDLRSTISVIIVAGACGIAAGTPLAILGAISRAARQGVIIKGGAYLEQLANVDTLLLDKTGTLTNGKPTIFSIDPVQGCDARELLEATAAAERNAEHPIALAIMAAAQNQDLPLAEPQAFSYQPGLGVQAIVGGRQIIAGNKAMMEQAHILLPRMQRTTFTRVFVARDGSFIGSLDLTDQIRGGATEAIGAFKDMGLRVELVTGDTAASAGAIAESLDISEISSNLLPGQKLARVDQLIRSGKTVAMIGDGINDGPALARAHVGVAMGGGTEIARETANVLLIGNDLLKFAATVSTARWCRRVILQNFYGTLIVDAIGIGLAAAGMLNPLLAGLIHVSSEIAFILNSTRLLPRYSHARLKDQR